MEWIEGKDNGADGLIRNVSEVRVRSSCSRQISDVNVQQAVLREHYLSLGHGNAANMKFLLVNKCSLNGMFKDIDRFVERCRVCSLAADSLVDTKFRVLEPVWLGKFERWT